MSEDFSLFIPDDHLDPLEALAIIDDSINHHPDKLRSLIETDEFPKRFLARINKILETHSENPETKREVQE